MSDQDILGTVFILGMLGLMVWAVMRMKPAWPYLAIMLALGTADVTLRAVATTELVPAVDQAPADATLVHARNPSGRDEEDLDWPNRVLVFLVASLALWLSVRPQRRAVSVGLGLSASSAGGIANVLEPLVRGYTTDYLAVGDLVINLADVSLLVGVPLLLLGVVSAELRTMPGTSGRSTGDGASRAVRADDRATRRG